MHTRIFTAVLLGFLALGAAVLPAGAQPRWHDGREGVQPLDRILPGIRRQHPGTFYDAQPTYGPNGDPQYRLKWMTPEGRVIWFDADARSGRVLGQASPRERMQGRQPYMGDPYDRGYGRMREQQRQERGLAPPSRYGNGVPYGSSYDRRGDGDGDRRGRGRRSRD
ncbi:MAG TPA: hypothetical protein VFQ69_02915 [Rhizomicrobium sp.]|jgi:hypothetical protein|nr:hypothetical protein [Rhizomicrobium sp.]